MFVQFAFISHWFISKHSLISVHVPLVPLPVYPGLQVQKKLPSVLVQLALESQL